MKNNIKKFRDAPFDCGCPACRKETRKWQRAKDAFEEKQEENGESGSLIEKRLAKVRKG